MQREEGIWIIRTYRVGATGEKIKFKVPPKIARNREQIRRELQRQEKAEQKSTSGLRAIARTVNASFYRTDGALVRWSYDDAALDRLAAGMPDGLTEDEQRNYLWDAAQHQMELGLRRARRALKQQGIDLRYWAVTSDRDKNGEPCRLHHHIIINPEAEQVIRAKWTAGETHAERLWDEPDHNDLVAYLLRQVRAEKNEKRYTPSRNLLHPQPTDRTVYSDAELAVPRGARLIERAEMGHGAPQYIRYVTPEWEREEPDTEACAQGRGQNTNPRARGRTLAKGNPSGQRTGRGECSEEAD
jgi:hypothetical protein